MISLPKKDRVVDFESEVKKSAAESRKTWLVIVYSLLMPGLGQVYNGQLQKGLVLFLLSSGFGLAITLFSLGLPFAVLAVFFLLTILVLILAIVDGIKTARKFKYNFQPKKYNRPVVYIAIYLVVGLGGDLLASTYIKHALVRAHKIPSGSMETTLLVGDHILIDRSLDSISRGDIVVFEFPSDADKDRPRDFIKRVIGVPGDKIEIRDKQLLVNDQFVREEYVAYRDAEILASKVGPRDNMAALKVPEEMYFTMGDNRDYSFDSRFWGFVAAEKISGRAAKIYWSWDSENSEVRWERIGQEIY